MMQDWKSWERQVVDEAYPLRQYLADGVFLTEFGEPEPLKAAIKIVLGNPEETASQLERWKLASGLSHPHLLRIISMGSSELDGVPFIYLVTEYAEENLSQVIPDRPLTADETREMLEPALSAIEYIHDRGFVHGHLKPSNFMAVDGRLRISSDSLCRVGPPGLSPADDVWSLGITLIEVLTQRREAAAPESLPAPFLEIARHCLQADPSLRWTVADVAARLNPDAPALPERRADRANTPSLKRYRLSAILGLVLAIAIAVLLVNRQSTAPKALPPAPVQPQQPIVQAAPAPNPVTSGEASRSVLTSPAPHPPEPPPRTPRETAAPAARTRTDAAEVVQRVMPNVTSQAIRTIHGKVKVSVRVHVDSSGNVSDAEFDSRGPSNYFAQSALTAARRWKFTPASGEWILRFEFLRTGPQVSAVRAAP
jgi:TonB family protein